MIDLSSNLHDFIFIVTVWSAEVEVDRWPD
jgi:hypothetical protein